MIIDVVFFRYVASLGMVALQTFIEVRACVCVCPSVMFDLYLYTELESRSG